MKWLLTMAMILALSATALGADWVGERTDIPGKFTRFLESRSSLQAIPTQNEVLHRIDDAAIATAQRALYRSVPFRFIKVENGLMVEMSAAEQQVILDAEAAALAILQAFQNEVMTDDVCAAAAIGVVNDKIDEFYDDAVDEMTVAVNAATASIALVTNVATAKTALTDTLNAVISVATEYSQHRVVTKKLARCMRAIGRITLGK